MRCDRYTMHVTGCVMDVVIGWLCDSVRDWMTVWQWLWLVDCVMVCMIGWWCDSGCDWLTVWWCVCVIGWWCDSGCDWLTVCWCVCDWLMVWQWMWLVDCVLVCVIGWLCDGVCVWLVDGVTVDVIGWLCAGVCVIGWWCDSGCDWLTVWWCVCVCVCVCDWLMVWQWVWVVDCVMVCVIGWMCDGVCDWLMVWQWMWLVDCVLVCVWLADGVTGATGGRAASQTSSSDSDQLPAGFVLHLHIGWMLSPCALTLLVRWQEEHLACKVFCPESPSFLEGQLLIAKSGEALTTCNNMCVCDEREYYVLLFDM